MRATMRTLAAACACLAGATLAQAADDAPLVGAGWRLATLDGSAARADAYLVFMADGDLAGRGGCNQLIGGYIARDDGAFLAGRVATTMMACAPAAMQAEQKMLAMLEAARGWRVDAQTLRLLDGEGSELATFTAGPLP